MKCAILFLIMVSSAPSQDASWSTGDGGIRSSLTRLPKIIHQIKPQYTKDALEAKLEGVVILHTTIGINSVPSDIAVAHGLGMGLSNKAAKCLQEWRFVPALRGNVAAPARIAIEIDFLLPVATRKSN
jgi:Gram-negative bacterial TonB protein C-terminal